MFYCTCYHELNVNGPESTPCNQNPPPVESTGWPSNIDTIISSTFLKIDAHVQELMGDGSTCTIILLKQFEDLVSAKVAWVGDSRCTLHVKQGYQDLVVDHRVSKTPAPSHNHT
jgi:serine/threonine protein phosphatase PrpC